MKISPVIFLIAALKMTAGQKNSTRVRQPILKLRAGTSVTIKCPFSPDTSFFSVLWTYGFENEHLSQHQYYRNRVTISNSSLEMTISDLTEEDSGIYCCQVESGKKIQAVGAIVEVIPTSGPSKEPGCPECPSGSMWLVLEIVRVINIFILFILLILAVKTSAAKKM
ncbi:hypothetical protein GDO81_003082 [Engystomops pustulosus]|uniref:Ig-like domain-containing protein n=1 Tax=Engystomops pustulosus TaxID=76066 RepID=A0AAV6ZZY0_ENGPU|nr:hypothetical protein GDO81_003082 [Engystomops pustulosus]